MTEKLRAVLADERFTGLIGGVNENVITIRGTASQRTLDDLYGQIHQLRAVRINYDVTPGK